MRELVYLSDLKLAQFLPTLRSLWPPPKVNFKAPLVEIGLEPVPDVEKSRLRHLARVVAHIEKSARWFLDPEITAGQWVHFEAPLNYLVVGSEDHDVLFFVDRSAASANYPTGGTARLVLHGSSSHLRIESQPLYVTPPPGGEARVRHRRGSDPYRVFAADNIEFLLTTLHSQWRPSDQKYHPPPAAVVEHLPSAISRLLRAIDKLIFVETAAWMAGYARITANLTAPGHASQRPARYVVASPLYIEYATPPA